MGSWWFSSAIHWGTASIRHGPSPHTANCYSLSGCVRKRSQKGSLILGSSFTYVTHTFLTYLATYQNVSRKLLNVRQTFRENSNYAKSLSNYNFSIKVHIDSSSPHLDQISGTKYVTDDKVNKRFVCNLNIYMYRQICIVAY